MSVETEEKKIRIVRIKDAEGVERLSLTLDEEGDLQIEQNGHTFYLLAEQHDDFINGVRKLFAGRPAKRERTGNPIGV